MDSSWTIDSIADVLLGVSRECQDFVVIGSAAAVLRRERRSASDLDLIVRPGDLSKCLRALAPTRSSGKEPIRDGNALLVQIHTASGPIDIYTRTSGGGIDDLDASTVHTERIQIWVITGGASLGLATAAKRR